MVQKDDVSEEKGTRRMNEGKAKHMKDGVLTEGGRDIFNWVKFKFNQCMFDTWHNGTHLCLLNTLILRDCANGVMMGLHRALQHTPNSLSKNVNIKHSHTIAPSFTCKNPCLSPIPSLCSLSPLSSLTSPTSSVNPLELFTAVDLELDNISVHKQSNNSPSSIPSLSKVSLPCSPLHSTDYFAPGWLYYTAMEATEEHTGGSSHYEPGRESSTTKLSCA